MNNKAFNFAIIAFDCATGGETRIQFNLTGTRRPHPQNVGGPCDTSVRRCTRVISPIIDIRSGKVFNWPVISINAEPELSVGLAFFSCPSHLRNESRIFPIKRPERAREVRELIKPFMANKIIMGISVTVFANH